MRELIVKDGATPIDPDESADLIPAHVMSREQLDAWEQANITRAVEWLDRRQRFIDVLDAEFLRELHRQMFGATWSWAGRFRKSGKNIGVPVADIPSSLHTLLADTHHWIEHAVHPLDEIAMRFHHRLVWIHAFPNGNGRHARLATDRLLISNGGPVFSWGVNDPVRDEVRSRYLQALRQADQGDFSLLLQFVRS